MSVDSEIETIEKKQLFRRRFRKHLLTSLKAYVSDRAVYLPLHTAI